MDGMARAETCRRACGFVDECLSCGIGAGAATRRRMEIRRFKEIFNVNTSAEQPVMANGCAHDSSRQDDSGSSGSGPLSNCCGSISSDGLISGHCSEGVDVASLLTSSGNDFTLVEVDNTSLNDISALVMSNLACTLVGAATPGLSESASEIESTSALQQADTAGDGTNQGLAPSNLIAESSSVEQSVAAPALEVNNRGTSCFTNDHCPPHGMVSLCGRRREMEDAVVAVPTFIALPCSSVGGCNCSDVSPACEISALHFFGVYDGHGGSQAANFCASRLHQALAEELKTFFQGQADDPTKAHNWECQWQKVMSTCFMRMDAEVAGVCWRSGECGQTDGSPRCCSDPIAPETVGSTATVAVVGSCQIIVGNCGDSRAVLSRGGVAVPLSIDHKPEREDEMARVEAAGGRVIYWNGYRVLGVLAMSRAIGDRYLKPYVIAEPEVKCIKRTQQDECLILASDGLWDVMSNEVVCDIARRALNCKRSSSSEADVAGAISCENESPAAQTAALLTRLALAKGSSDNISVVVVDLRASR